MVVAAVAGRIVLNETSGLEPTAVQGYGVGLEGGEASKLPTGKSTVGVRVRVVGERGP